MGGSHPARDSKVVVTGATGHIGYHIAGELVRRGHDVHLLVRSANAHAHELANAGATVHVADLRKPAALVPLLRGAACLFHAAAENTTDQDDEARVLDSTLGLTRDVLTAAADAGVGTVVYTSSVVVLGRSPDPRRLVTSADRTARAESPYVRGKLAAEQFCDQITEERGLDVRRVYPSWVVGPGDLKGTPPHQVIAKFLEKGQRLDFRGGISIADVEEVARGHVSAWLSGRPNSKYVLSGDNVTYRQFFATLSSLTGKPGPLLALPKWSVVTACSLLKSLGLKPPMDPGYARGLVGTYSWYDSGPAQRELGYKVVPACESLARAVQGERQRAAGMYHLGRPRVPDAVVKRGREEALPLLITGAPGWLGNRFVDVFINGDRRGWRPPHRRVRLLVEPRLAGQLKLPDYFEVVAGDLLDPQAVGRALEGVGTVFHLAGAIYPPRVEVLYRVNAEGTKVLADQCVAKGVRRVLYMGTDSICGHATGRERLFREDQPASPYRNYGRSKWMGEEYLFEKCRAGLLDVTSLRGFWFFGPFSPARQQNFLNMLGWPMQIVFGNGRNFRSISHCDNTVAAFFAAENARASYGKWYWIGDPKADYTTDEVYARLCAAKGHKFRPLHVPGVVCTMARAADWLLGRFGRIHPTIHAMGKFTFDIAGTADAARRDFGYEPVVSLVSNPEAYFESLPPAVSAPAAGSRAA